MRCCRLLFGGLVNEMEHRLRSQLADLGQEHVLAGLASGLDASQQQSLVNQVSSIDLPLFRRALADVVRTFQGTTSDRYAIVRLIEFFLSWSPSSFRFSP